MLNRIASAGKVPRSPMALSCLGRSCHQAERPRLARCFDLIYDRDRNFTAQNFYTISTDTHIDHLVIVLAFGAHKNATGTVHFEALLDQNLLLARRHAMGDHPGGAASGGRTGGGIVAVVKNHAGVEAGFGIDGFAANEVKELSAERCEIFGAAAARSSEDSAASSANAAGNGERNPVETV
jgi:hypothetical protein